MKKSLKAILALVLVCAMMFTLVACSAMLKGTYVSDGLVKSSFTFKDDNKVEFSVMGIAAEGDYEIKDGKLIITYSLLGISSDLSFDFEKKGGSIFIDGAEYVKEK